LTARKRREEGGDCTGKGSLFSGALGGKQNHGGDDGVITGAGKRSPKEKVRKEEGRKPVVTPKGGNQGNSSVTGGRTEKVGKAGGQGGQMNRWARLKGASTSRTAWQKGLRRRGDKGK